ncbi:MAG: HTTM domain-containing protein [Aeromicrobium sp.]|uniref:HTTM domain-containing protein n=1 Tax=Aeromicrobium sp. TaxID=1871063 RepID=UPI0039E561D8
MSARMAVGESVDWLVDRVTEKRWSTFGLAATRVTLAATILLQTLSGLPELQYTWGVGQRWAETTHTRQGVVGWAPWLPQYPAWAAVAVVAAMIVAAVAMMLGWRTRVTVVLMVALWGVTMDASPILRSGGEDVVRLILFYLMFADSGRAWSLDARRRRKAEAPERRGEWLSILFNNLAVVLIAHQIVMIYVGGALWKFASDVWLDGTAVYYPLQVSQYSPWVHELGWLYSWPVFVMGATWTAMLVQIAFPLMLLTRRTRIVGFVLVTATHIGIGVLMGLMYFSLAMIAADAVLISDTSWRTSRETVRKWWKRLESQGTDGGSPDNHPPSNP